MRRQAEFAGRREIPYDREAIRSGGVASRGRSERGSPPSDRQARRDRRQPRATRSPRSLLRTLRTVLLVLLVLAVVVVVLVALRAASFNATVSTASFPSTALLGPLNGSERVNVLMIGYGGRDHAGAYLADSIQILSIDPETNTTTSIPIPRDLWVEGVASFPQNGKINEVFSAGHANGGLEGAGDLLAEVVSEITGLEVEYWISIDFQGFQEMVDAVGGITVDNPRAFSYATHEQAHERGNWNAGTFEDGEIRLDGDEALMYSRARYTSVRAESTDFARSVRQARVIRALRAELGGGGVTSIVPGLRLMDALEGRMFTNLSVIDLYLLAGHLSADRRVELAEDVVLTATRNSLGQYILLPSDWAGPGSYGGIRSYIASELAKPVEDDSGANDATAP